MGIAIVVITAIAARSIGLQDIYKIHIPINIQLSDIWHWQNLDVVWSLLQNYHTRIAAITIALVASIETILSIHAIDHIDDKKRITPLDRELVAQ